MKIKVVRYRFNGTNTIGRMYIDGAFFANTLEDIYRPIKKPEDKVKNETAIPYGTYEVVLTMSNRFKRELPLLKDVPFFEAIRIHGGNTEENTEGCSLIGENTDEKKIWNCRAKLDALVGHLKAAKDTVTIEITKLG